MDVYTFGAGAITFKWQFNCMYTTETDSVCSGPWHITCGTGDFEGAQGGGTAIDLCVDHYDGPNGAYTERPSKLARLDPQVAARKPD